MLIFYKYLFMILTTFTISSSELHQVKLPCLHCQGWVFANSANQSTGLSRFGKYWSLITSCNKSQQQVL